MLIKDLKEEYPLVYKAALDNQEAQGNKRDDSLRVIADKISGGFRWSDSEEGRSFWNYISEREFDEAKKIQPHLFKEESSFIVGKLYREIDGNSLAYYAGIGAKNLPCFELKDKDNGIFLDKETLPKGWVPKAHNRYWRYIGLEKKFYPTPVEEDNITSKVSELPNKYTVVVTTNEEFNTVLKNLMDETGDRDYSIHKDYFKEEQASREFKTFHVFKKSSYNWGYGENNVYGIKISYNRWKELTNKPVNLTVFNEAELTREAKRLYPKGTILAPTGINKNYSNLLDPKGITGEFYFTACGDVDTKEGEGYLYKDGVWADIVPNDTVKARIDAYDGDYKVEDKVKIVKNGHGNSIYLDGKRAEILDTTNALKITKNDLSFLKKKKKKQLNLTSKTIKKQQL